MLAMQNMPESQKKKKNNNKANKQTNKQTNKKEISNRYFREHQQITCFMLSRFMAVKGGETF